MNEFSKPEIVIPPMRPMDRLMAARDALAKASAMASETADHLCGSIPTAAKAENRVAPGGGMFGAISEIADHINSMAEGIAESMDRIGRST